jgi:DNA-binding transcriptional LysR family regulator
MRLDNFDLNLLVAFEALLLERNVTKAARRLNVTQSAMSASLKRLRDAMGDPILLQHGKAMIPTPHALALAPDIASAIASLRQLIQPTTGFDPATTTRTFRIAASDYIATVALAPLLRALSDEAPGVRFDLVLPTDATPQRLARGDFDLVLTPREFLAPGHPAQLLFEERHVVVGCRTNPLFSRPLCKTEFADAGHVAVRIDGRNTYIENELSRLGLARRVEVFAPSFIQAPWLLPGTRRIALMHERLARLMAPVVGLVIAEMPFAIPAMHEMMQNHAAQDADAGLGWLKARLTASLGPLD